MSQNIEFTLRRRNCGTRVGPSCWCVTDHSNWSRLDACPRKRDVLADPSSSWCWVETSNSRTPLGVGQDIKKTNHAIAVFPHQACIYEQACNSYPVAIVGTSASLRRAILTSPLGPQFLLLTTRADAYFESAVFRRPSLPCMQGGVSMWR